ncbi:MAG: hypothetical protein Q8K24_11435 [Hydrogenophaga sp.]|uniref:hypothetical protein n=1 Tax=Hydrogenophaga sp. TaxID=1904254 RepID=UPI00274AA980|nr:hypothetical protein [Hydrogenophaga sp.]MDP2263758.1 hypothetical protein [Hydrogenophaga sp.]MDZ4283838.1 hypothetical protein [Hydrogenophaga sp.]
MRALFLKDDNGWWRTLRHALVALLLLILCVYGICAALTFLLGRLPSIWELVGISLPLGRVVVLILRWHHNRRMRRTIVSLQDSALW